jgi:ABC-type lipoprotein release transport system permease subunit
MENRQPPQHIQDIDVINVGEGSRYLLIPSAIADKLGIKAGDRMRMVVSAEGAIEYTKQKA